MPLTYPTSQESTTPPKGGLPFWYRSSADSASLFPVLSEIQSRSRVTISPAGKKDQGVRVFIRRLVAKKCKSRCEKNSGETIPCKLQTSVINGHRFSSLVLILNNNNPWFLRQFHFEQRSLSLP